MTTPLEYEDETGSELYEETPAPAPAPAPAPLRTWEPSPAPRRLEAIEADLAAQRARPDAEYNPAVADRILALTREQLATEGKPNPIVALDSAAPAAVFDPGPAPAGQTWDAPTVDAVAELVGDGALRPAVAGIYALMGELSALTMPSEDECRTQLEAKYGVEGARTRTHDAQELYRLLGGNARFAQLRADLNRFGNHPELIEECARLYEMMGSVSDLSPALTRLLLARGRR